MTIIKWFDQTLVTYLYIMHTIYYVPYITSGTDSMFMVYNCLEYFKQYRLHDNTFLLYNFHNKNNSMSICYIYITF